MVSGRNRQNVSHGAAVATSRGAKTKGPASGCPVGAAPSEASRAAGVTRTARHLEGNKYSVADPAPRDGIAHCDDLGDRFVPDRERTGKQAVSCHRQIKVTTRHRKRAHDRPGRIGLGIRSLTPLDSTRFHERQLAH